MQKSSKTHNRFRLLVSLIVLGLFAALFILPYQFRSEAGNKKSSVKKGLFQRTESHVPGLENYDIRKDSSKKVNEALQSFRDESGKSASALADVRDSFVRGEENLRKRVPTLKIEYNSDIRTPEVITPDVWRSKVERLTSPRTGIKNSEILRNFVKENNQLFGMNNNQLDDLKVIADYTNPSGNMSFAQLEQRINGIPVFRGEIKAGFTKNGEIVRIINNLAPGLDYDSLSTDFQDPLDAVKSAAKNINYDLQRPDVTRNKAASDDLKVVFGEGDWATTAEKMYFPTEVGVARPAWRVLIWQPVNAFYVIVDAETGTMLWRKNITNDQTQAATYNVYTNPLSMINTADSPAPLKPGPVDPALGTQGALLTRMDISLIGNEGALSFNNNGWITDGGNSTDGNAVEAGLDLGAPNGVDAPVMGASRVFTSAWNPPPGNPAPGDEPTVQAARDGAVIQMFYVMNRYHDALYQLGFTEQAFNFQQDNFGRGGSGGDRVSAEGQDSAGTENANFSTPSDGGRGRMQMFIFNNTTPNRDGTADADIIIHEVTHGLSNRLHGNSAGLNTNMSGGLGEGWSDFYAFCLLSSSTDPVNGPFAGGGHVLLNAFSGSIGTDNYYYGIRSFPKATLASTGGPNNRPHNPLTFADLDSTQEDRTDGAFPPKTGLHISTSPSQVHRAGEVWSSALWEVRALLINRLGHVAGNQKALQVVTDGMKLAPIDPTFLTERDAIIAAAAALPLAPEASADAADVREGFRLRGMGFSATVDVNGGSTTTRVTEAFDVPNVVHTNPFAVSDSTGNNNGFPDPGENVLLSIPVTNTTGGTVNNVVANVNGGTNVAYGNISDGQTVTMQIPYTIPGGEACGSSHQVAINVTSDIGARPPVNRSFTLGQPSGSTENFDGVTAPALPAGWTSSMTGDATGWVSRTNSPSSAPNSIFAVDIGTVGQSFIETPAIPITSTAATLKFKMNHNTENTFDGVVLDIKIGAADYADIITAGGSFVANGYTGTISSNFGSPIGGRMAWSGNSNGYKDVEVTLPAAANGSNIQLRWNMATDSSVTAVGVDIDDIQVVSSFACGPNAAGNGRADFDGDGRTDRSVFRPSEGNWYMNQSTAGFGVINWGISTDTIVPGDYDGDGKTDTAVFRPTDTEGVGDWWILNSNGFTLSGAEWGLPGDVPVVGDYDGDGKDDIAVYRDSNSTWFIINSNGTGATITAFGSTGNTPVVGDFDGDGKADLTSFNAGAWSSMLSGGGMENVTNGAAGDVALAGDFDGDGQTDQATWRDSNGSWYVWLSTTNSQVVTPFGTSGDIPTPGDYDGDGKDDLSIYRGGQWWTNGSTSGVSVENFGLASDKPIPANANP